MSETSQYILKIFDYKEINRLIILESLDLDAAKKRGYTDQFSRIKRTLKDLRAQRRTIMNSSIYVMHRPEMKITAMVWSYADGVEIIDSYPVPERYEYFNASRHWLNKHGLFPFNKKGDQDLIKAIGAAIYKNSNIELSGDLKQ